MWHKLIQTFVDNPVNESSPYISRVERQRIMLKFKLMTAILAVAGMTIFILGDTYLTTGLSVACAAVALPMSIHLVFRWLEGPHDFLPWVFSVVWILTSGLMAIGVLQDIGITDIALSTAIDPVQKVAGVGYYISFTSIISILLAVVVPSSPMRDDDKG